MSELNGVLHFVDLLRERSDLGALQEFDESVFHGTQAFICFRLAVALNAFDQGLQGWLHLSSYVSIQLRTWGLNATRTHLTEPNDPGLPRHAVRRQRSEAEASADHVHEVHAPEAVSTTDLRTRIIAAQATRNTLLLEVR